MLLFSLIIILTNILNTILFAVYPRDVSLSLSTGKSCVYISGGRPSLSTLSGYYVRLLGRGKTLPDEEDKEDIDGGTVGGQR